MSATQEKKRLNPGDLVQLNPKYYGSETVDAYGVGLYIGLKRRWHQIYWFKFGGSPARHPWREFVKIG